MTRFTDGKRILEITIASPEDPVRTCWEDEFFGVGGMHYNDDLEAYEVADVNYLVDQAQDLFYYTGDHYHDEKRTKANAICVHVWDDTWHVSLLDIKDNAYAG